MTAAGRRLPAHRCGMRRRTPCVPQENTNADGCSQDAVAALQIGRVERRLSPRAPRPARAHSAGCRGAGVRCWPRSPPVVTSLRLPPGDVLRGRSCPRKPPTEGPPGACGPSSRRGFLVGPPTSAAWSPLNSDPGGLSRSVTQHPAARGLGGVTNRPSWPRPLSVLTPRVPRLSKSLSFCTQDGRSPHGPAASLAVAAGPMAPPPAAPSCSPPGGR